jgi:acetyl-CoA carboxylase carboxyltransferase component
MSALGITQIAAVMGACVAGGAYLPIMSDETLMVEGNGSIFLAGPYLVKAAIGEDIDVETLGGAETHNAISGIADYKFETEHECIDAIKKIISKLSDQPKAGFDRIAPVVPSKNPNELYGIIAENNAKPYDMLEIIERIVDAATSPSNAQSLSRDIAEKKNFYESAAANSDSTSPTIQNSASTPLGAATTTDSFQRSSFDQFKKEYGKTILCGYARIDGWAVGIVANQRLIVRNKKGEMQLGGVLYNDSSDKAARFILNCNQKKIPLLFLQDVTGFMVGSRSEHSGIIKDGAKLVNAVANSVVPKITIVIGNSYGAGNYAMCGKAYDPRFIYAWPSAKISVMGGEQAAKTLLQIQVAGKHVSEEEQRELLNKIKSRYENQTTPYYAAARLWVDDIIDPIATRQFISEAISAANHNTYMEEFKTGVWQV